MHSVSEGFFYISYVTFKCFIRVYWTVQNLSRLRSLALTQFSLVVKFRGKALPVSSVLSGFCTEAGDMTFFETLKRYQNTLRHVPEAAVTMDIRQSHPHAPPSFSPGTLLRNPTASNVWLQSRKLFSSLQGLVVPSVWHFQQRRPDA
jgi:hypothetical protein